jgi:hypothetical protein
VSYLQGVWVRNCEDLIYSETNVKTADLFKNKQRDDLISSTNGTQEFPLVTLGGGITAKIVLISPELAKEWLALITRSQRKLRPGHVRMIARDIEEGRWLLTGESFIFDRDGGLLNGQHRLTAIIEAGVAVLSLVVWGVDPESFVAMDSCTPRSKSDVLGTLGHSNATALGSVAHLAWLYMNDVKLSDGSMNKLSPVNSAKVIEEYPELARAIPKGRSVRGLCHGIAVPAFCYWVFRQIDEDDADRFFHHFATGEDISKGNPILALRTRLMGRANSMDRFEGNKFSQYTLLFLIFKTWNLFRGGKQCINLRINDNETFPELI